MGRTFVRGKRRASSLIQPDPLDARIDTDAIVPDSEGWVVVVKDSITSISLEDSNASALSAAKSHLLTKKKKRMSNKKTAAKVNVDDEETEDTTAAQIRSAWITWSQAGDRLRSFTEKGWHRSLLARKSKCTPEKMALAGWFCTGKRSAKCYACAKEMEDWEENDDPMLIHEQRCRQCPLTVLKPKPKGEMTLRELIRLNVAIEYCQKRKVVQEESDTVLEAFRLTKMDLRARMQDLGAKVESEEEEENSS